MIEDYIKLLVQQYSDINHAASDPCCKLYPPPPFTPIQAFVPTKNPQTTAMRIARYLEYKQAVKCNTSFWKENLPINDVPLLNGGEELTAFLPEIKQPQQIDALSRAQLYAYLFGYNQSYSDQDTLHELKLRLCRAVGLVLVPFNDLAY